MPGLTEPRTAKYPRAGVVEPIEILLIEDNPADADLTREKMEQAKIINRLHVVEDGDRRFLVGAGEVFGTTRKRGVFTRAASR